MDTLENIFYDNFLGYSYWFMYIRILHLKGNYISVDQARYATYVVAKYIDTATTKEFHKTTLHHYVIFTNKDASTTH